MDQLAGIGGGRSLGFGPKRVRSLPDGVAQVLAEYLEQAEQRRAAYQEGEHFNSNGFRTAGESEVHQADIPDVTPPMDVAPEPAFLKIGDLCPECGQAAVVNEEGCRKCYACGYSEC